MESFCQPSTSSPPTKGEMSNVSPASSFGAAFARDLGLGAGSLPASAIAGGTPGS